MSITPAPDPVLVVAGTPEAAQIVRELRAAGQQVTVCQREADRLARPEGQVCEDVAGGVAGARLAAVIDAGHGFEAGQSLRISRVCAQRSLPYVRVLRPCWTAQAGDLWHPVESIAQAVQILPARARVLANTGRASIPAFEGFAGDRVFLRQLERHDIAPPWPFLTFQFGQAPFSVEDEMRLFTQLGLSGLICRNVGGAASASKLTAARALGLPVYMVRRPAPPPGACVAGGSADALQWFGGLCP
jgi:precorrin-6A/cobalt-precorrin-6A reductase